MAAIRDLTHGEGAHKTLDASSAPDARAAAVRAVRSWGTACFVGERGQVTLDVSPDLLRRQVTLVGSWTFSKQGQAECAEFVADQQVDVEKLFTHRWQLEQAEEAYKLFDTQTTGKARHPAVLSTGPSMTNIAAITGGASGIGRGTARRLLDDGWTVVALDRDEAGLEAVRADFAAYGDRLHALACDVTAVESVRARSARSAAASGASTASCARPACSRSARSIPWPWRSSTSCLPSTSAGCGCRRGRRCRC